MCFFCGLSTPVASVMQTYQSYLNFKFNVYFFVIINKFILLGYVIEIEIM